MAELRAAFRSMAEAEAFFRQKVNLPTERWTDLWQGQHARAFVVAGATRDALLTDLREAVDAAISKGETLEDFRARFRDIVARHGWSGWTGQGTAAGEAWRTAVIYHTNLRTAYMAGRWETLKTFPYLKYQHNTVANPREAHKAWDGLIIARDDPWWNAHYPPNGWGCRCSVTGVSAARLRAEGRQPDAAPAAIKNDPPPEWSYHVGEASSGRQLSEQAMQTWRDLKSDAWDVLTPARANEQGRSMPVPLDPLPAPLETIEQATRADLQARIETAFGASERVYTLSTTGGFTYHVVANAETLADHMDPARTAFAALLPDVLTDPFEVWQSFEQHRGTGRVVLRTRYVRAFDMGEKPGVLVVLEAVRGQLQGWTMIPVRRGYLDKQRYGRLLYARPG